ncbi:MAG TPA: hypothetical protein VFP72_22120 [Kineosporiaceae bacterium]|nr:hypothetical protein [Kineosporiaceae bacterium]
MTSTAPQDAPTVDDLVRLATGIAVNVHHYATTEEAYQQTGGRDDIRHGDVIIVRPEGVVAVMLHRYPVAVTGKPLNLPSLADGTTWDHVAAELDTSEADRLRAGLDLARTLTVPGHTVGRAWTVLRKHATANGWTIISATPEETVWRRYDATIAVSWGAGLNAKHAVLSFDGNAAPSYEIGYRTADRTAKIAALFRGHAGDDATVLLTRLGWTARDRRNPRCPGSFELLGRDGQRRAVLTPREGHGHAVHIYRDGQHVDAIRPRTFGFLAAIESARDWYTMAALNLH